MFLVFSYKYKKSADNSGELFRVQKARHQEGALRYAPTGVSPCNRTNDPDDGFFMLVRIFDHASRKAKGLGHYLIFSCTPSILENEVFLNKSIIMLSIFMGRNR